jgi:hypothetical protein
MQAIYGYLRHYLQNLDKKPFIAVLALTASLVFINYTYGIEERIVNFSSEWMSLLGFYFLFAFVFIGSYLIQSFITKKSFPDDRFFYFLLLISPLLFAGKMSFNFLPSILLDHLDFPSQNYWITVLHWPVKAILMFVAIVSIWKLGGYERPVFGLGKSYTSIAPYFLLLACMVPLLALAAADEGFQQAYPRIQRIAYIYAIVKSPLLFEFLYELAYGSDFFTIELFFRGFLVLAFARYVGMDAILPMAAFYCAIHFGKPLPECISSFFGGLILGAIVIHTRSIWGGLTVRSNCSSWNCVADGDSGMDRKRICLTAKSPRAQSFAKILCVTIRLSDMAVKNQKSYHKLISRILFQHHHLSGPGITAGICLPTLQHRASSPRALVYMAFQHARFTPGICYHTPPWALTPLFHPHSFREGAVIFCGTICSRFAGPGS